MTLITFLFNDHQIIKLAHSLISVTFLFTAIWLFYRSLRGYFKNLGYFRLDKSLSYIFIVNLYLQLIFGLLLMANPAPLPDQEGATQDIALKMVSNRFWPIEHIVLMLFALFIANLGLIFSNSTHVDREKHRKVLVYYTIALIMIGLSLSSTYLI
jgi:Na+-driven multidrug efflux pump